MPYILDGGGRVGGGVQPPGWTGHLGTGGTGAASRSQYGSYWKLPDGRFFVPQVETPGAVTSWGGEGGMDIYGPSTMEDYAFVNEDKKGGYRAKGRPGDYGTVGTFDNTGGILPGYGQAPSGLKGVLGGDTGQYWGPLQGKFYTNAPEEEAYKIDPEETLMQAITGGANSPGIWAPSPLGIFTAGVGGYLAGAGSLANAAGSAAALEGAGAFGGEAFGAAANAAGHFGGSIAPWAAGTGLSAGAGNLTDIIEQAGNFTGGESGMNLTDIIEQAGNFTGGEGGGIDWSNIDKMIETLGPRAWEAENLITAESIAALKATAPSLLKQAADLIKQGAGSAKTIADALGISEGAVNLLGKLGSTALGVIGSNNQSNALADLAKKYQEYGAPSRARYEAGMTPGFDPMSMPGYAGALDSASQAILRKLSATGGNPYGSPGALIEANKAIVSGTALPAIQEYLRMNANTGFGQSMNAALGLQTGSINADRGMTTALASGLGSLTQPQNSLADLLRSLQMGGLA